MSANISFFENFKSRWIGPVEFDAKRGGAVEFCLDFVAEQSAKFRCYVTADQYYSLFCDGKSIGSSNERGTLDTWFADQADIEVEPGPHILSAVVWHCGQYSAAVLESRRLGFYLVLPKNEQGFSTGVAGWRMRNLPGMTFAPHKLEPNGWTGVHPELRLDWRMKPGDWEPASVVEGCGGKLVVPMLGRIPVNPHQEKFTPIYVDGFPGERMRVMECRPEDMEAIRTLAEGGKVVLPPRKTTRMVFRLSDYSCGWPLLTLRNGRDARIRLTCAEALFLTPKGMQKGEFKRIDGKFFRGVTDEFISSGEVHEVTPPVWRAGNFLEIAVVNADEPVTLENLCWMETGCPLFLEGNCCTSDETINHLIRRAVHTFRMNAHDRFLDCPYYEQLSYTGDGRIELLLSYVLTRDDRLARKMLLLFAESCAPPDGFCRCRIPAAERDLLPSFALWFVALVYDYALWRNDRKLVGELLPAVHFTLQYFLNELERVCVFHFPPNGFTGHERCWNFIDWVPAWTCGENHGDSPVTGDGFNTIINWMLVYVLRMAADMEYEFGEASRGELYRNRAVTVAQTLNRFFDPDAGLFNTRGIPGEYAEHTQILAVLSGMYPKNDMRPLFKRMLERTGIDRVSLFFDHYLWLAGKEVGELSVFRDRLQDFLNVLDQGSRTLPETFHQSRSECHGWGAMPVFHLISTIGGIRPGSWGFSSVIVEPEESAIDKELKVCCVHPGGGMIRAHYREMDSVFLADIELPPGLNGIFLWNKRPFPLKTGKQQLAFQSRNAYEKKPFSDSPIVR